MNKCTAIPMKNLAEVAGSGWSEERVRQMLAADDFSYQDIQLPHGLSTGGDDRSETVRAIFPDDMEGKSVLDIGCRYGYFCFEAIKRGASRVVGVDVDPESIRKARLLADCLGVEASFRLLDIEVDPIEECYDYVLFLNILHHLKNPISAIDKLIAMTRERLVLEVAGLGPHDRKKLKLSLTGHYFINRAPVIYVGRNGTSGKHAAQKFFITPGAINNLLLHQRQMFADVKMIPSYHKGRYIAVGHKRQIDKLVVVAGPTSAGKTTLVERLRSNEEPELAEKLGIEDGSGCVVLDASQLNKFKEPKVGCMILHYDTLRPFLRSAQVHARDEALDILSASSRVVFLTIWCPQEILLKQHEKSEIAPKTIDGVYRGRSRQLKIRKEYQDNGRLVSHYRNWLDYCRTKTASHLVVVPSDGMKCLAVEEWEDLAEKASQRRESGTTVV